MSTRQSRIGVVTGAGTGTSSRASSGAGARSRASSGAGGDTGARSRASSGAGIDRSGAVESAGAGRTVVAAGRQGDLLGRTASLADRDIRCVPTDVTSPTDVTMLFDRVVADFDRVEPLFNKAGVSEPFGATFPELSYEE
ncbi:SDR family oxidoreductase [Streptomyces sp. NPDC094448]|uniref:SDR family oxidoreductase n=1 Tax=Streptomyces sp. NPDC094448 TaxID=3366063 RepID=UPI003826AF8C